MSDFDNGDQFNQEADDSYGLRAMRMGEVGRNHFVGLRFDQAPSIGEYLTDPTPPKNYKTGEARSSWIAQALEDRKLELPSMGVFGCVTHMVIVDASARVVASTNPLEVRTVTWQQVADYAVQLLATLDGIEKADPDRPAVFWSLNPSGLLEVLAHQAVISQRRPPGFRIGSWLKRDNYLDPYRALLRRDRLRRYLPLARLMQRFGVKTDLRTPVETAEAVRQLCVNSTLVVV